MPENRDQQFDAELRNVPLPDELLARLRAVGGWTDADLDDELRRTPAPAGMMERLRSAVADEMLDDTLRDVPLPWDLLARLRIIPIERPRSRLARLTIAASLFFLISGAYLTILTGILSALRPQVAEPTLLNIPYDGPLEIRSVVYSPPIEIPYRDDESTTQAERFVATSLDVELVDYLNEPTCGPVGEVAVELGHGLQVDDDILLLKYHLLGARHSANDQLPQLDLPPHLPQGGIAPPLLRQYNRTFLLQHRVHPPVSPASHPSLATLSVPLSTKTTSFDSTKRLVAEGRLPDPREIRVEDFLATVDDHLPPAKSGQVALRVSAGPSVFGRELNTQLATEFGWPRAMARRPAGLLQVGAVAGRVPTSPSQRSVPTHLTVALDVSASMRWAGRLEMARRSVEHLLEHLEPHDRLSLVVFNGEIVERLEEIGRDDAKQLLEVLDRLEARGGTNLTAGLQAAVSLAMGSPWQTKMSRRLVLITDGRVTLPDETIRQACDLMEFAARHGLQLQVLELNDGQSVDPVLARVSQAADGKIEQTMSAEKLRWSLVETLTGQSSVVAADVQLKVSFRPQVVGAYRLLGHEAVGIDGLTPVEASSELRSNQSATALFEVWLKPGSDDNVGWAEVQWRKPDTGELQRVRQRISRLQFATSLAESSLSLQAASLAAETAEVLRRSPFAQSGSRGLAGVLDIAERVNPRLSTSRSFQRFVSLVESAEQVRSRGAGD